MNAEGPGFQILAVPASDLDFRAAVNDVTEGIDLDGPGWPTIVADRLRSRYPRVAIVAADPLGAISKLQRWYVLRNGDRGSVTVRRILVIDDDPSTRSVLADVFDEARFDVRMAASGEEALELIESWPPDLILVDLGMPFMTGEEFAERYRATVSPQAPMIVISGAREAMVRGAEMGARSVLDKPFDLDVLVTLVDRYA